jgi:DNA transformation protein and related proteins
MGAKIRNLGPVSMQWLAAIEVHSLEELREVGAVNAYRLLALRGYRTSLNLLWAMEAALRGVHWMEIGDDVKAELRARLEEPWDPSEYLGL